MRSFGNGASRPPRRPVVVLVAHDIHDHGGMERAFSELIHRGGGSARFIVVAQTLAADLRAAVDWRRVRVPRRPFPFRFLSFFLAAVPRMRRGHADVRHTLGAIVPTRTDLATVQFCHAGYRRATGSLAPPDTPPLRRANTALARLLALAAERWCYQPARVHLLAAVSRGVRAELETHYPGTETVVTPNGVDLGRFRPDSEARKAVRAEQGVEPGEIVTLFVGGDWERKGLEVAIPAVAVARDRGSRTVLWVVGPGDRARYRRLAEKHGVADHVHFLGPREDTERFYQAADIFVLPTLYETFSLAAYEAAASGLPVVATPVSGVADLVGDNDAGVLVARDADAVGEAMAELARDSELRGRMAAEGRRRSSSYDWDTSVEAVLNLYRYLVGRGAAAPAASDHGRMQERRVGTC
jgi:glycosyltransferase involved in cell wall biosynthesis